MIRIEVVVFLVDVCDLHCLTNRKRSAVRLFFPENHSEQRSLSSTVRTNNPNDTSRRQGEGEILVQQLVSERFRDAHGFDDLVSKTGTRGDKKFESFFPFLRFLGQ